MFLWRYIHVHSFINPDYKRALGAGVGITPGKG